MKNLVFKQNDFLLKNNFSTILKSEVNNMVFTYFKNEVLVPLDSEVFDKEISDLIIKLQEEIDDLKKKRKISTVKLNKNAKKSFANKKHIYKNHVSNKGTIYKYIRVQTYLKSPKKFIK